MAGENTGNANPLDQGANPNSVETAADDFTRMLQEEGAPEPRRRKDPEKPVAQSPEGSDDAEKPSERQPKRERPKADDGDEDDTKNADPILDDAPEADQDKGDADDDDQDPDADQDDEDEDDTDDEDEDDDPEGEILQAKVTVKVNGKESEITVQEARDGYMRQADYTQKAERNAREYEEIETYAAETAQHRKSAVDKQDEALALIEALQPSKEDWEALKAGNPGDYIAAQEHWAGLVEKAKGILAARNALVEEQNKANTARDAKYYETQERKLVERIPALRDPKKAEQFRSTVMEYGLKAGYSEEELIKGAVDHRDLETLYKAAMYDKTRASISAAGKKGRDKAPKPSGDGRARVPANPKGSARRNADKRLARSGSVHDAADSFAAMIMNER